MGFLPELVALWYFHLYSFCFSLMTKSTPWKLSARGDQAGWGVSVRAWCGSLCSVGLGGHPRWAEHKPRSSVLGATRSSLLLKKKKLCPPAATSRPRLKLRQRGHNPGTPPRTKKAAQAISCRELQNLEVPLGPEGRGGCHGCKHAQLDELSEQGAMLREELTGQHSIQEYKLEINVRFCVLTQADSPNLSPCKGKLS